MNIVILGNKHKQFPVAIKGENYNILGYVNGGDIIKQIDSYKPNILVVCNEQKINSLFFPAIEQLKSSISELRIIYLYGEIKSDEDFFITASQLIPYSIYDIYFDTSLESKDFPAKFCDLLNFPMRKSDLQKKIHIYRERTRVYDFEIESIADNQSVNIDLTKEGFEMSDIDIIHNEQSDERIEHKKRFKISVFAPLPTADTIAVTFELASFFKNVGNTVAVAAPRKEYNRLVEYYKHTGSPPISVHGFEVYEYEVPADKYDYAISATTANKEDDADIKIAVLQPYEWTATLAAEMINTLPYAKNINYIFYPASKKAFMPFAKQFTRKSLKSYRLECSVNPFSPDEYNKTVYADIIKRYTDPNKRMKKRYC